MMYLSSLSWLLSAISLTTMARLLSTSGQSFHGGEYYIFFTIVYVGIITLLHKFDKLKEFKLSPVIFVLGSLILFCGEPLFENDHYRYLWEGKVLFSGFSPYIHAPNSEVLDGISFVARGKIGYPHLTSVYPPIALVWFGIGGVFGLKVGLIIHMALNSILVWFLFKWIADQSKNPWPYIIIPYLQKEFIQSIHVDLFSVFFIICLLLFWDKLNFWQKWCLIFMSIWSKVIGIIAVAFMPFERGSRFRNISASILLLVSLPASMYFVTDAFNHFSGMNSFSKFWVWNPGFYSFLHKLLDIQDSRARTACLFSFVIWLLFWIVFWLWRGRGKYTRYQISLILYLIYSGLMFFTPVYNAWYAIWFLIPALLLNLNCGILYAVFSVFCYTQYWNPEYGSFAETATHIWFLFSLIEILKTGRLKCTEFKSHGTFFG